jgi:hypothetical protein
MTKEEALKLALEALELHGKQYPHMVKGYCLDAITAIKQALEAPTVQEPMAYLHQCRKKPELKELSFKEHEPALFAKGYKAIPLADTTPTAQRQWVGLSDLNIDELENEYMKSAQTAHQFLRAIEAKLKERNQ